MRRLTRPRLLGQTKRIGGSQELAVTGEQLDRGGVKQHLLAIGRAYGDSGGRSSFFQRIVEGGHVALPREVGVLVEVHDDAAFLADLFKADK